MRVRWGVAGEMGKFCLSTRVARMMKIEIGVLSLSTAPWYLCSDPTSESRVAPLCSSPSIHREDVRWSGGLVMAASEVHK